MAKLELIYETLTVCLPMEVDLFWNARTKKRSEKECCLDIDNLQGIVIYLVLQMRKTSLITECFLIDEFSSSTARNSRRFSFLNYVKAGIDFLLELNLETKQLQAHEAV